MGEVTNISWAHSTFNPWIGCTRVSPGCTNCYAEAQNVRWRGGVNWGPGAPRQVTSPENWRKPLRWNKAAQKAGERHRVFCASLADIFDDEAPEGALDWLWELIRWTPKLDWLLLTKRPERIRERLPPDWGRGYPNVWLGVTAEDQRRWNERVPILQNTPAVIRFVSVEPQLEEIRTLRVELLDIDLIIIGGESGPTARQFDTDWPRRMIRDCRAAGVAPFVKQLGARPSLAGTYLSLRDSHGGDPAEWPEDLRVREFPTARAA